MLKQTERATDGEKVPRRKQSFSYLALITLRSIFKLYLMTFHITRKNGKQQEERTTEKRL